MKLGVVMRGDHSGLAAQTIAVASHLDPVAVLGVDLQDWGRGPCDWTAVAGGYGGAFRVAEDRWPNDEEVRWLVDQVDVVYTAEVTCHDGLGAYCHATNKRLVIHANPELWLPKYDHGQPTVWAPTDWRLDLLPERAEVVPMPVDDPHPDARPRQHVDRFLHIASAAMADRNGTHQVIEAIPHISQGCEIVVAGHPAAVAHFPAETNPKVRVRKIGPVADRWTLYDHVDALLLPRRYGGLSLPMLEAASRGLAVLHLATDRYAPTPGIRSHAEAGIDTSGGRIICFGADPVDVAWEVDEVVSRPGEGEARSAAALEWARSLAWSVHAPAWLAKMGA